MGKRQRYLMGEISRQLLVPLRGATRAESSALHKAARSLERQGLLVRVLLWNEEHTHLSYHAARPGARTPDDRPVEALSVPRVRHGGRMTRAGSLADLAARQGVCPSTIWRRRRKAAGGQPQRPPSKPNC